MAAAKARSNSATLGPWATQPLAMTAPTASISSWPSQGSMTLMRRAVAGEVRTATGSDMRHAPTLPVAVFDLREHRLGRYAAVAEDARSEEHTSELQSLMRISYAVFCLKKKTIQKHKKIYQKIKL